MKVLFVILRRNSKPFEEPGIASIASVLRENGHTVEIRIYSPMDLDLNYIYTYAPDIVGTSSYDDVLSLQLSMLKQIHITIPSAKIALGGYSASYNYEYIMKAFDFIDFCTIGEGEICWKTLADSKFKKLEEVPNLVYRGPNGKIHVTDYSPLIRNLDILPTVSHDILMDTTTKFAQLTTSRGCTHNCSFCLSSSFWKEGKKRLWRGLSISRIIAELREITERNNCKKIIFNDASFEDPDRGKRALKIANAIIANNLHLYYLSNFRVDFIKSTNDLFMNRLIESGLVAIFLGVESGNLDDLLLYNKHITIDDIEKALCILEQFDVLISIGFINFNPYSTISKLKENIEFLYKHVMAADFYRLSKRLKPYRGTDLFEQLKKDGLVKRSRDGTRFIPLFKDPRVETIYNLMQWTIKEYPMLAQTTYIEIELGTSLKILAREAAYLNHSDCSIRISHMQELLLNLKRDLNNTNYFLVSSLLEMTSNNIVIESQKEHIHKILLDNRIVDKLENLFIRRDSLFEYLSNVNHEFDSLLY